MNTHDESFFVQLGTRIAQARKHAGLTQKQLCEQLGIAQQTLAHYEGGKLRLPTSLLPTLAQILDVAVDELLGMTPQRGTGKRGPSPRIQQQLEAISVLPRTKQAFIQQMLDTMLAPVPQAAEESRL